MHKVYARRFGQYGKFLVSQSPPTGIEPHQYAAFDVKVLEVTEIEFKRICQCPQYTVTATRKRNGWELNF
jgi:hypothetical protein